MSKGHGVYSRGKLVGVVVQDVFVKNVRASEHFLKSPHAIAFDAQTIVDAKRMGAKLVCVTDVETNRAHWATLARVESKLALALKRGGYEPQRALLLHDFAPTRDAALALGTMSRDEFNARASGRQLSLLESDND